MALEKNNAAKAYLAKHMYYIISYSAWLDIAHKEKHGTCVDSES
jgi:hypothetical protein